jgi:RNA recognition motif-containing protein
LFEKIKRDGNGQSRGFGFIRFKNYESQLAVINKRHFIDGRHVDVKIPDSKVRIIEMRKFSKSHDMKNTLIIMCHYWNAKHIRFSINIFFFNELLFCLDKYTRTRMCSKNLCCSFT